MPLLAQAARAVVKRKKKLCVFGGSTATNAPSVFGGSPAPNSPSLFGGSSATNSPSIFGGSATSSSTSTFGGFTATTTTASSSPSIFSSSSVTSSASIFGGTVSGSIFGGAAGSAGGLFGNAKTSGSPSMFGNAVATSTENTTSSSTTKSTEGSLFSTISSGNMLSFGDLASQSNESGFGQKNTVAADAVWAAKGQPVFGKSPKKTGDDDDDVVENDHDPHFEPVVPLPDLVEVKTGEEDLEVIFSNRGKLYRYDSGSKQWKERGIGDFKILRDPATNKFRLLQRREQVHKLCCNHYLTTQLQLRPMETSETAWCWYAKDYSESLEGTDENWTALGAGDLHIQYDDDFFGARIIMTSESGETLAEHIIAIQTTVHKEGNSATWTVLNLEPQPQAVTTFKADFASVKSLEEFVAAFHEGKEYAENSGIMEQPSGEVAPEELYYGQGADEQE
ncbi:hypothetical protein C7M84_006511 [Penaeus vannamei]|uniref:RanBD1 domain-containing protein n=1 Tax=Penaeus vannamei TaxID=6689 RepID=A0A3R7N1U6_PENVA|nr:hypothetical protein C7M84_006511 [Penaeus vannamei]